MITVKTYNWEDAFAKVIFGLRKDEMDSILIGRRIKAMNLTMLVGLLWWVRCALFIIMFLSHLRYFASPAMASLAAFSVAWATGVSNVSITLCLFFYLNFTTFFYTQVLMVIALFQVLRISIRKKSSLKSPNLFLKYLLLYDEFRNLLYCRK